MSGSSRRRFRIGGLHFAQRLIKHRLREGARVLEARIDPVQRAPHLGHGAFARGATRPYPADHQRGERVQERERVGCLKQVGFRPTSVLVDPDERFHLFDAIVGNVVFAQPPRRDVGAPVLMPAVVLHRIPVTRRVPVDARIGKSTLDVVQDGGETQALAGLGIELDQPVLGAQEMALVRVVYLLHPLPRRGQEVAHGLARVHVVTGLGRRHVVTGRACST